MTGLISIENWTSAYETELENKGLLGWVLSADKEVKESSLAFDGEEQPGLEDMAALRQWKMDWTSVKNCLERALGSSGDLVHQHSLYGAVRTDSTCRAIKRLCTIRDILTDLQATGSASSTLPPSSTPIESTKRPSSTFAALPPTKVPRFSSPSPAGQRGIPTSLRPISAFAPSRFASPASSTATSTGRSRRDIDRDRVGQMKVTDTWGFRCIRCGRIGLDKPSGHATHDCKAVHYDATGNRDIIFVSELQYKPFKHLIVEKDMAEVKVGDKICATWNWTRTWTGECTIINCTLGHRCSLCFLTRHRALDCVARSYLPGLPPRPPHLVPADPDVCLAQHLERSMSSAPAIQSTMPPPTQPQKRLPLSIARPPDLYGSASGTTASPTPSLSKYKIEDAWFAPLGKALTGPPPGQHRRLPKSSLSSATFRTPIRIDPKTALPRPESQMYPSAVPSVIQPRPGYRCRILLDEIVHGHPAHWCHRMNAAFARAATVQSSSDVDLSAQTARDSRKWAAIRAVEQTKNLDASAWEVPRMGLVGDKRFQSTDGDTWNAGLVLMAHYPPAHCSPYAFCATRDGGAMLQAGGLVSPSLSGNHQLAFSNVVPLFFDLENDTLGMSIPDGKGGRKVYPQAAIDVCISTTADDILERCANGACQFLVSFGANPREACKKAYGIASINDDFETYYFEKKSRKIRKWEAAAYCAETILLLQTHGRNPRRVPSGANLFNHPTFDQAEKGFVHEDLKDNMVAPLVFKYYVICHRNHPDKCVIMHTCEHMSFATDVASNSSLDIGARLDISLSLCEDLFFNRHSDGRFPRPDWRFYRRKVDSTLVKKAEKAQGISSVGLSEQEVEVISLVDQILQAPAKRECLPSRLQTMLACFALSRDDKGIPMDPKNSLNVIKIGNEQRIKRFLASGFGKQSSSLSSNRLHDRVPVSSVSAISSAPAPPPAQSASLASTSGKGKAPAPSSGSKLRAIAIKEAISTDTRAVDPGPGTYPSTCECGQHGTTPFEATGRVLMREYKIVKSGKHKSLVDDRPVGFYCITGIPLDPALDLETTMYIPAGNKTPRFPNVEIRERIRIARSRPPIV